MTPGEEGQNEGTLHPSVSRVLAFVVFVGLLLFTLALAVGSIPAGVYAIFGGHLSNLIDYNSLVRPYLWIGPIVTFTPFSVSLGGWFLILTAIYCLFIVLASVQKVTPLRAISTSYREGLSALTGSPLLVTIIAIGFLSFTASLVNLGVSSSGVPIGNVIGDPMALLMGFTNAPLVEEFGFRMVLIGLVALILSIGRPWKDALGALWRPSKALEGLAVGGGTSVIIWAATGLSAVTFGACHVVCGSGTWDIGKFPEAAYGGLVLGVLYVKYGFHVAVMVHWGIDYFGSAYSFFGQAAYGIPWSSNTSEFIGQYLVDIDMLLLFGIASFLLVSYWGVKKLAARNSGRYGLVDKGGQGGGPQDP